MTIIAEGKYRAKARAAEFGENCNGTPFVAITFELVAGPSSGQTVSSRFYLSDSAAPRTIEGLRYTGCTFPRGDITDLEGLGSRECEIVIEHEESARGNLFPRVKWINSGGSGGVGADERLSAPRKQAFAARLRGMVLASDQKSLAGPGARSKPLDDSPEGNPGINDSDIPF